MLTSQGHGPAAPKEMFRVSFKKTAVAIILPATFLLSNVAAYAGEGRHHHPRHSHQSGIASVYGHTGSPTASGERTNLRGLTAAHRSLPFGTRVRVTNKRNGRAVTVRINDRGPFIRGRVIDLTPAGASALGFSGLAPVTLAVMQ
ncbi:MAG: septal ring lytic transglycosylase RlpA family protein [Sphingopyxis terrae]|nr:septal ring lytic transglycosylase RlpA family protein [Sphingopyxis terrae]